MTNVYAVTPDDRIFFPKIGEARKWAKEQIAQGVEYVDIWTVKDWEDEENGQISETYWAKGTA